MGGPKRCGVRTASVAIHISNVDCGEIVPMKYFKYDKIALPL